MIRCRLTRAALNRWAGYRKVQRTSPRCWNIRGSEQPSEGMSMVTLYRLHIASGLWGVAP